MRARPRSVGFTLVEVVLSAALLGMIFGAAALVTISSSGAYEETSTHSRAASAVRRSLERCSQELSLTSVTTLTPDPLFVVGVVNTGVSTLTFTPIIGAGLTAPVWDAPRRLQLSFSPTDANDGVDNDGDGVVDDCQLELVLDIGTADQRTIVLRQHLREYYAGETFNGIDDNGNGLTDERGFHVTRTGSLLTVRICVEQPGRGGATLIDTLETSIDVRN